MLGGMSCSPHDAQSAVVAVVVVVVEVVVVEVA
jgi:hypothetical protein